MTFRALQQEYQPQLGLDPPSPDDDILNVSLHLPSSLSVDARAACSPKLVSMEKDLRLAQCYDALSSLRLHLHSMSRLLKDKYINIRHQGPNTKSRELLKSVSARITTATDRYNAAYLALSTLETDPRAKWRTTLFILHKDDVRGLSEPSRPDHADPERAGAILARTLLSGGTFPEGYHTTSWIWRGTPMSAGVDGYNECLSFF